MKSGTVSATLEERFWSKVDRRGPNECWPWLAKSKDKKGYGLIYAGKHPDGSEWLQGAHRVAFYLEHGRWPEPCCLHNCPGGDNPACCNAAHLREGTPAENSADMVAKGRHGSHLHPENRPRGDQHYSRLRPELLARGDRNGARLHPERMKRRPGLVARGERVSTAKLQAWQIPYIRALLENGVGSTSIARAYGVNKTTIQRVSRGKTWAHIDTRKEVTP